jgi:hypothetical protein
MTTDPDRILDLAPQHGSGSARPSVKAARAGAPREQVVIALAREIDAWQQADAARVVRYERAARDYLAASRGAAIGALPLPEAHRQLVTLAERLLPTTPPAESPDHADAQ